MAKSKKDELEDKVQSAVDAMKHLASEEGERKVTGYLSKPTAETTSHEGLAKYHGQSIGDKKARKIAAKMVEIYHGKLRGVTDTYKGDTDYWIGFARRTMGDHYETFLQHIKDGKISAAVNLLESAIMNEDLSTRAHGIADQVYAMSPEDRLKWGEKMAEEIGSDADAQKLAEHPETAYSTLRAIREAKRPAKKPKPEPAAYK